MEPAPQGAGQQQSRPQQGQQQQAPVYDTRNGGHYGKSISLHLYPTDWTSGALALAGAVESNRCHNRNVLHLNIVLMYIASLS